jgi:hypothetical protein
MIECVEVQLALACVWVFSGIVLCSGIDILSSNSPVSRRLIFCILQNILCSLKELEGKIGSPVGVAQF